MFTEVPVLPVVVPLAGAVLIVLLWHLQRRHLLTVPRVAVAVALCVYAAGIVANTVFPIFLDKPASDEPWHVYVDVTPLIGYELADAVQNVVVFVPLGILLSLATTAPAWRVLLAATGFSLGIEATQFVTAALLGGGHVADVDDLLSNVVGAALGLAALATLTRVRVAARLVDRFRWA